jgi:SAM-dependent methyltransferase
MQQQRLQASLDTLVGNRPGLRILEAGCGSATMLRLPPDAYVTGLDISQRQLDRNRVLDEKILGDIQTHPLPEAAFDLIICWDVLEHVPQPDRAVANLSRALRAGGLLLLAMPNARSIKGLLTKCTPHRFHLWMYRTVYGQPLAGVDGRGPFPTYLRSSMAPTALGRLAQTRGLEIVHVSLTESVFQARIRGRLRLGGRPWDATRRAVKAATLGRLSLDETEVGMILRRPEPFPPSTSSHEVVAASA